MFKLFQRKRDWAGLLRDQHGAVAMEAGFVLPVYIYFTLFLLQLSVLFFFQEVLDHAVSSAARTIQVGSASSQASTSSQFVSAILCPQLNGLMDCNQVMVTVSPVTNFYSNAGYTVPRKKDGTIDSSAMNYCNGVPGQMMLLHALYNSPINLWPISSTVAGRTVVISTAAFQNELFPPSGSGC